MQRTKNSQGNLQNRSGGFKVPYIKIHYEGVVINTVIISTRMYKQANEQYRVKKQIRTFMVT